MAKAFSTCVVNRDEEMNKTKVISYPVNGSRLHSLTHYSHSIIYSIITGLIRSGRLTGVNNLGQLGEQSFVLETPLQ